MQRHYQTGTVSLEVKMKILVVDDEAASRVKMQTLLNTFGVCQAVDNGLEAVKLVEQAIETGQPFQLITLDIEMPDLDGAEVLQLIRRSEVDHHLPRDQCAKIIMVTGRADKNKVVACIRNGCDDYIAKPFNIQMVRAKVEKVGLAATARSRIPRSPPVPPPGPKS